MALTDSPVYSSSKCSSKSFLESILEDGIGPVEPHVIPYRASLFYDANEVGSLSATSASGFAALNYVRLAWKLEAEGVANVELLRRLISQLMIDDAMTITVELKSDIELLVEDLLKVPLFEEAVTAPVTLGSLNGTGGLKNALSAWFSRTPKNVQATILSRFQEMIICVRIPVNNSAIYVLLDSHPRDSHPEGPAMTITRDLDDIISSFDDTMFKDEPRAPLSVASNTFSVHCLASKPDIHKLDIKDLIARSVAYLSKYSAALAASEQIASLRVRAEQFRKNRKSVVHEVQSNTKLNTAHTLPQTPYDLPMEHSEKNHAPDGSQWHLSLLLPADTSTEGQEVEEDITSADSIDTSTITNKVVISDTVSVHEDGNKEVAVEEIHNTTGSIILSPSHDIVESVLDDSWQGVLAQQLQAEEEMAVMLPQDLGDTAWLIALQKQSKADIFGSTSASPGDSNMLDWRLAVQLQQEIDLDSIDTRQSTQASSSSITTIDLPQPYQSFECGVCGDLQNITNRIDLSDCGHTICKECLSSFTRSKIDEGRYPIFCPECIAERPRAIRTQVGEDIFQRLDIPKHQLNRLQELQLVSHCISLQCPSCKETMNVDRSEFSEQNILVCPLPRCGHKWCKSCQKTLASSQERHRCKNSNIDRLMKRKGWKHCPGCKTPVQKEMGCNHITCATPGCNVHFCYKCGVLMIDTTHGGDVGTAVTDHFNDCRLFDRKWKCTIQ